MSITKRAACIILESLTAVTPQRDIVAGSVEAERKIIEASTTTAIWDTNPFASCLLIIIPF